MIYSDHPLVEAARYTDAQGTEHGMEGFLKIIGLELEVLMHVADQRAMRAALLTSRGEEGMMRAIGKSANKPIVVPMNPDERALVRAFMPAYLDGLIIGWEARRLASE